MIVHSHKTVYVCERAVLNMITDGTGIHIFVCTVCACVFVCGRVGMQDRRSAGRDKCSNLSSPSHSHPSAQTSKSLPLGLPRTHTQAHTHTCVNKRTHTGASYQPYPQLPFQSSQLFQIQSRDTHGDKRERRMDSQCHSTALCRIY